MEEYRTNGALLGWLIDPKNQTVYIYRPSHEMEILINPTEVSGDPELPGLTLLTRRIFDPIG